MKIAYFFDWADDLRKGVPQKVFSQIREWKKLGHDVSLFLIGNERHAISIPEEMGQVVFLFQNSFFERCIARYKVIRFITKDKPEIVYMRYGIFTPAEIYLMAKFRVVLEVNTNVRSEYKKRKLRIYTIIQDSIIKQLAAGVVSLSNEINNSVQLRKFPNRIVIGNSILTRVDYPIERKSLELNHIFVCSEDLPWHGIQEYVEIAKYFPEDKFHIVGIDLKIDQNVPKNIIPHGQLFDKDLNRLYQNMDFGWSTLNLSNKEMHEASPLKSREYLAHGLPVIGKYTDTDISKENGIYLELNSMEDASSPQNLQLIKEFIKSWQGRRIEPILLNHLRIENTEHKRLEFFSKVNCF